jgi:hypothetical protein
MIYWDFDKFVEDLCKLFDGKITTDMRIAYHPEYMELMNRPEVILDLKEKC